MDESKAKPEQAREEIGTELEWHIFEEWLGVAFRKIGLQEKQATLFQEPPLTYLLPHHGHSRASEQHP